jgi:hypothetical protein
MPTAELRVELGRLLSTNGSDGASHAEKRPTAGAVAAPKAKKVDPKAKKRR